MLGSAEGEQLRAHAIAASKKLRHRGPDWSGCVIHSPTSDLFTALSHTPTTQICCACNSHIVHYCTRGRTLWAGVGGCIDAWLCRYSVIDNNAFCHERLAIVDPMSGKQVSFLLLFWWVLREEGGCVWHCAVRASPTRLALGMFRPTRFIVPSLSRPMFA